MLAQLITKKVFGEDGSNMQKLVGMVMILRYENCVRKTHNMETTFHGQY